MKWNKAFTADVMTKLIFSSFHHGSMTPQNSLRCKKKTGSFIKSDMLNWFISLYLCSSYTYIRNWKWFNIVQYHFLIHRVPHFFLYGQTLRAFSMKSLFLLLSCISASVSEPADLESRLRVLEVTLKKQEIENRELKEDVRSLKTDNQQILIQLGLTSGAKRGNRHVVTQRLLHQGKGK